MRRRRKRGPPEGGPVTCGHKISQSVRYYSRSTVVQYSCIIYCSTTWHCMPIQEVYCDAQNASSCPIWGYSLCCANVCSGSCCYRSDGEIVECDDSDGFGLPFYPYITSWLPYVFLIPLVLVWNCTVIHLSVLCYRTRDQTSSWWQWWVERHTGWRDMGYPVERAKFQCALQIAMPVLAPLLVFGFDDEALRPTVLLLAGIVAPWACCSTRQCPLMMWGQWVMIHQHIVAHAHRHMEQSWPATMPTVAPC